MTRPTKFSVVIPLYNKQEYILRAVMSVLTQTHEDLELIVVDDGSTDRSADALSELRDERFRIFSQANAGEGAARNMGSKLAQYDWIAYLDADDAWMPQFLETVDAMIHNHRGVNLCATGYCIRTPMSETVVGDRDCTHSARHENYFAHSYRGKLPFCASSVAIRKSALMEVGGFSVSEPLGSDQDLWCRLLSASSFALNRRPCAVYHEDASGRICDQYLPDAELPFSRRLQSHLDNKTLPVGLRKDAQRYIAAHLIHLSSLHARQGNYLQAIEFLRDSRTLALPLKRALKLAMFRTSKQLRRFYQHTSLAQSS